MKIGLDIGSTTMKCVVLDEKGELLYTSYERHYSQIIEKAVQFFQKIQEDYPHETTVQINISGSAGMGIAERSEIPFVQEVFATRVAVQNFLPEADVVIELGGEDAKILFLTGNVDVRMNGSCAGGTGAFIDQMATLLNLPVKEMNEQAKEFDKIYTVASRCGVFAKSDIQPLLNQGAKKSDISASIFSAVVNQTIAGLAQGRPICGNVVYLGGPLTFLSELRKSFDNSLNVKGICPENSLYYVAMGAALLADKFVSIEEVIRYLNCYQGKGNQSSLSPLFCSEEEYQEFTQRHQQSNVLYEDPGKYAGSAFLGIDAGSTTIKLVVISPEKKILLSDYRSNSGNPIPLVCKFLSDFYEKYPNIQITGSAVTGYGEEIVKNAFLVDHGIVETMAHFAAAKEFLPQVEFIIDIGGQDIKCFKIANGAIDDIFLNEACSSGCGSFLQTFASALGYSIQDFARLGLFADKPVDLGSRCTVFMNSSVKQAQKDGVSIENISAGLSISVVKNALYKVIRVGAAAELGKNIVVQGGTFLNDAILRAFEQELKVPVIRPAIAGLMGAYGAALYAERHAGEKSTILNAEQLKNFTHQVKAVTCNSCSNRCQLTVNTFGGQRKFIGGNRCERPVTQKVKGDELNLYQYKWQLLKEYQPVKGKRGRIGIPLGLNLYELLPFWHKFFTTLGFEVITSPASNRSLYLKGQHTIPSDTVCFPAKLMHGHIQTLIDAGIERIFYPCMTYNLDEKLGDNHYNCPVVAYYPEVIGANMPEIRNITCIFDYVGLHRRKDFPVKIYRILNKYIDGLSQKEVKHAAKAAYKEYGLYFKKVRKRGREIIKEAQRQNRPVVVLAGRPYHVDPEINHGIDGLISSCGAAIVSEDSLSNQVKRFPTMVLNQWTYHSRLYAAAKFIRNKKNMNLVQLVSFGCGVDAITTDEIRTILEGEGKIYTQIKIDEITNLGAVKIRLRSLFAAIGNEDKIEPLEKL